MAYRAQKISAGEFKAKCLRLMDEVNTQHKIITITKHGIPVAKLIPIEDEVPQLLGLLSGSVVIKGNIIEPLSEKWSVDE